ncbi:MAG: hypothetical protein WCG67_04030 [Ferruginibacter sp.]
MKIYVKYLILLFAFIAGYKAFESANIAAGIVAAGAFIAFALIEIQDLKIINNEDKEI